MDKLQKIVSFIGELEKLKKIKRQNRTLDSKRYENSAEHSWHVALMAIMLKEYLPSEIDIMKVVKMLLIHDIVEIDTGDTFLYNDQAKSQVISEENDAANRIFGLLPKSQKDEYANLWFEFENQISIEAKSAAIMDGIQPLLNHVITAVENENPHELTKSQILNKKMFIKEVSPQLWKIAEDLIDKGVRRGLYKNQ